MFKFGKKKDEIASPMKGELLALEDVSDPVFSQKVMGDGFAVDLQDSLVVAPFDATVVSVFPSGHAYGLQRDDGVEVLIHIGIDTVELADQAFDKKVEMGQQVKQGDPLVVVNLEVIRSNGKSLQSPVIFTSGETIGIQKEGRVVDRLDVVAHTK